MVLMKNRVVQEVTPCPLTKSYSGFDGTVFLRKDRVYLQTRRNILEDRSSLRVKFDIQKDHEYIYTLSKKCCLYVSGYNGYDADLPRLYPKDLTYKPPESVFK